MDKFSKLVIGTTIDIRRSDGEMYLNLLLWIIMYDKLSWRFEKTAVVT